MASVRDSQKDLISETVSVGPGTTNNNKAEEMFVSTNSRERKLCGALFVSILGKSNANIRGKSKIFLTFLMLKKRKTLVIIYASLIN